MGINRRENRMSREELAHMDTEKLKEIIRLDSQGVEEYPMEDILYILDLVVQREREAGEPQVDVDAAWSRFQREHLHPEEAPPNKVRRWNGLSRRLGTTAAALALVLVGLLTARAAGWNLFGSLPQWNDEVFTFGSLEPETTVEEESEESTIVPQEGGGQTGSILPEVLEYDTVQEALDACGITDVKAPTWLPEGCELVEMTRIRDAAGDISHMVATFEYQGDVLALNIFKSGPGSTYVEKVSGPVVIKDIHGQTVYVIENALDYTIAWKTGSHECYLSGPNPQVLENIAASMLQ